MSDVPLVDTAVGWANALVRSESRGPGDLDNAMRRVARRHSLPYGLFWKLRYRRPKDVAASLFISLREAYEAECARQLDRLAHDLEVTKANAGPDCRAVRAAQALVGAEDPEPRLTSEEAPE